MRLTGLTRRDAIATCFVAAALTLYALTEAGVDAPGMDSARMRASAIFLLGMFACGAGSTPDAFTARGVVLPITSVLSVLGLGTLIVGVTAIISGAQPFLAGLIGGIVLLWLGASLRHMTTPRAEAALTATPVKAPRELVMK